MEKQTLGERLRVLRERAGLSIQTASEKLGIRYGRLVGWENDNHKPNAGYIVKMSELYDVSADEILQTAREYTLSLEEAKLVKIYRGLDLPFKDLLMMSARSIEECYARTGKRNSAFVSYPIYDQSASAGTGQFLDSDHYEIMEFPESAVPAGATFGVRVSGDSMEPVIPDGSIVFVHHTKEIEPGEIGVFILNGEAYVKKLNPEGLESINPKYKIRVVGQYDDLRVVGKVIGEAFVEK